jgi:lipopolysaccharide/colanic/teichoic acid biosynthesis glycosyltransferase
MTTADMTQSQFLASLTSLEASHQREATHQAIVPSNYFRGKEILDRILGLILLIPALPLIGLLVMAVRLTSRGPGIFWQTRVGKGGRIFTMLKLRSMRIDAEALTGPVWANEAKDNRVTVLGYWLRRLHLDELPQLFNVVRGEMSLVGPRPERPEFVTVLTERIPGYLNRIKVQPGITGLAQVNLPPDTDLESVQRKLVLDGEYINTASLALDVRILACTFLRLLGLRGGRGVELLGLRRIVILPSELAAGDENEGPDFFSRQVVGASSAMESSELDGDRRILEDCAETAQQSS